MQGKYKKSGSWFTLFKYITIRSTCKKRSFRDVLSRSFRFLEKRNMTMTQIQHVPKVHIQTLGCMCRRRLEVSRARVNDLLGKIYIASYCLDSSTLLFNIYIQNTAMLVVNIKRIPKKKIIFILSSHLEHKYSKKWYDYIIFSPFSSSHMVFKFNLVTHRWVNSIQIAWESQLSNFRAEGLFLCVAISNVLMLDGHMHDPLLLLML